MSIKKRPIAAPETMATRAAGFDGFAKQKPSKTTIDCSDKNLEKLIAKAVANDADEIIVRIGQYDQNLDAANFQAIVRFSDRTRVWACVVHPDPYQALCQVVQEAAGMPGPTIKERNSKHVKASQDTAGLQRSRVVRAIKRPPSKVRGNA